MNLWHDLLEHGLMHEHGIKWIYHRTNGIPRGPLAWTFIEFHDFLFAYLKTVNLKPHWPELCHLPSQLACAFAWHSPLATIYIEPPLPSLSYKQAPPPFSIISKSLWKKMVMPSFTEELCLSFAIFLLACLYLFLVVLESSWSNSAATWLPQDCFFPSSLSQKECHQWVIASNRERAKNGMETRSPNLFLLFVVI